MPVIQDDRNAFDTARSQAYEREYASAIKRFDLLEQKQEQQLASRWQQHRDQRATDVLVTSHLRLAAKTARRYRGYGLPLADLVAEANLGLVIAAAHFEPNHGSRFSTYALWWIRAKIHDCILRSRSLVRIGTTHNQRKLFFGLRREMRKFAGGTMPLTPEMAEAVAHLLEVTPREVTEMDSRLNGDVSLNMPASSDREATEWEAMLVDGSPNAEMIIAEHDENAQRAKALHGALNVLSKRERRVFEARRLADEPLSLEQLGRELAISGERVRQIEKSAFEKVKRAAKGNLKRKEGARQFSAELEAG
ncbi:RNA polymerase factor sigma-32 [Bradyrhizobium japonicum]|nr:RNA polymerase factor sigma-32 [Bradyrhizobium japonicum]